jgi:uncharacterized protein YjiS (DUF1127 family)
MTTDSTVSFDWTAYRVALASGSRARVRSAIGALKRWLELHAERRALARLDERALKDIGLSRVDALRESDRPFWDDGRFRRFD